MSFLKRLLGTRGLRVKCPNCQEDFPIRSTKLFDASVPLPSYAADILQDGYESLTAEREDLRRRRRAAHERPMVVAKAVRIGKVVEKIASGLPGFPVKPSECRSLFEPIDYVVFRGLSRGSIECVDFVDVKSGKGVLGEQQRVIRRVVEGGRVSLEVMKGLGGTDVAP
jgi:predicted Holliday junction resolvase-like endonuclease